MILKRMKNENNAWISTKELYRKGRKLTLICWKFQTFDIKLKIKPSDSCYFDNQSNDSLFHRLIGGMNEKSYSPELNVVSESTYR